MRGAGLACREGGDSVLVLLVAREVIRRRDIMLARRMCEVECEESLSRTREAMCEEPRMGMREVRHEALTNYLRAFKQATIMCEGERALSEVGRANWAMRRRGRDVWGCGAL
ncbi:unnamed protein product [Dovyalis caffra]|uniref:Uncharacterized protein n=1 Tax=Dovyalis caffra TaxID=77055 RepID=A0AAV1RTQ6_9ROSI|nr:unnamed protein product [Dovyalis caffra]